jgi:DNA-directed RNA polymerase specialized sigma24 family protein
VDAQSATHSDAKNFCVRIPRPERIGEKKALERSVIAEGDQQAEAEERRYTPEEVQAGLEALADDDWLRLRKISRIRAGAAGMDADDLVQAAFIQMLTARSCKVSVSIRDFAIGAMRSIASTEYRRRKKQAEDGEVHVPLAANDGMEVPDNSVSPEDEALARIFHRECLERISAVVADDEKLQFLIEGLCDNLRGKELSDLLETDAKGLDAAKTKLARRLAKAFKKDRPI